MKSYFNGTGAGSVLTRLYVLVTFGMLVGCNHGEPERYSVSGSVSLDGKPVPACVIVLASTDCRCFERILSGTL